MNCDSYIFSTTTNDLVKGLIKLQEERDLLHFNKIAKDYPIISDRNTDISGKFKIEILDTIYIDTFCALSSKTYAYNVPNAKEQKKLKGKTKKDTKTKTFDD